MSNPDKPRQIKGNPFFVRRRGLYLPAETADVNDLREHLSVDRAIVAVNREHEWVRLAQDTQHDIRLADLEEHAERAKRSRRQRAKDAAEAAKLADLYRSAKAAGARARVEADMLRSAEVRAVRLSKMRGFVIKAGMPVLLAFAAWSTTGVHAGVVRLPGIDNDGASWWTAWLVEPALITIVALIIIGRAWLRSSGGNTDKYATGIEVVALGTSLALNIFGGWAGGWAGLGAAVAHSLGPIGAAGTAFLMGLFDSYIARADPWDGAQRLADMGLDDAPELRAEGPAQELQLPSDTQLGYAPQAAQIGSADGPVTHNNPAEKPRKQAPPKPRKQSSAGPVTSGYAPNADPGTQAAREVKSGGLSLRKAALKYGVSDGTVRNRIKAMDAEGGDDEERKPVTIPQFPIAHPREKSDAVLNGHSRPSKEFQ